jgi:hypothetical protein
VFLISVGGVWTVGVFSLLVFVFYSFCFFFIYLFFCPVCFSCLFLCFFFFIFFFFLLFYFFLFFLYLFIFFFFVLFFFFFFYPFFFFYFLFFFYFFSFFFFLLLWCAFMFCFRLLFDIFDCGIDVTMHETDKGPRTIAFSRDGRWLATAGPDGVRLLDRRSHRVQPLLRGEPTVPLAFTADSTQLRAITTRRLLAWSLQGTPTLVVDRPRALVPFEESAVGAISAEGERWIALGPDPRTGRLSWLTGAFDAGQVRPVDGFQPTGSAPELSHDGRWVAWGKLARSQRPRPGLAEKAPVVEFPVPGSANVTFTPDARHLMVAGPRTSGSTRWGRGVRSTRCPGVLPGPRRPTSPSPPILGSGPSL